MLAQSCRAETPAFSVFYNHLDAHFPFPSICCFYEQIFTAFLPQPQGNGQISI
jgi:hypothetical protein